MLMGVIGLTTERLAEASELNFGVTPVLPENQTNKSESYFDITPKKGEKQILEVKLANRTAKDVVVEAMFNRATTNRNGIVEYGVNQNHQDSSLKLNIEDVVKVLDQEVTVKANSDKVVRVEISEIKEDFPGVLASGLTFKEKRTEERAEDTENQGLAIKNEFAYVVALLIHGNVLQKDIPSEVILNDVKPDQLNYRNVILANLQNTKEKYVNKVTVAGQVTKKGQTKSLYSIKKEHLQLAPNSNFDLPIPLEGQKLKAGTYEVTLNVVSDSGEWQFKKEFTITAKKAKTLNKQDVSIAADYTMWYLIAGGVIILLLIVVIILLITRKKKQPVREVDSVE